jgi:hypothetical protein
MLALPPLVEQLVFKNGICRPINFVARLRAASRNAALPVRSYSRIPIRPGNAAFRAVRGPGAWNVDFSLAKNFGLREDVKMQFRVDNPEFGKITTTRGARTIQLHGRLSF